MPDQQTDADANRRIRNVERRPMMDADEEIKKVGDLAEKNAVDHVAERAAENAGQHQSRKPIFSQQPNRIEQHKHHDRRADADEKKISPLKHTERNAGIFHVNQRKNRQQRNLGAKRQACADNGFRNEIQREHRSEDGNKNDHCGQVAESWPTAATQRAHNVGCAALCPTSAR